MADPLPPSTGFPSPSEFPEFWQTCMLGPFLLPPDPKQGVCRVKVSPGIEVDSKKAKGAKKSTKTVTGQKDAKVTVTVEFSSAIWPAMQVAIEGLLPSGTPVDIADPNTMIHKIGSVMILDIGDGVQWSGGKGTYTWNCEEWTSPAAALGHQLILRLGSRGPEVARWRQFLLDQGFSIVGTVADIFDANTVTGTREFQTREGITVDGIVGAETFGAASRFGYAPPPPVPGGASGGSKTPDKSAPGDDYSNPGIPTGFLDPDEGALPGDPGYDYKQLDGASDP